MIHVPIPGPMKVGGDWALRPIASTQVWNQERKGPPTS